MENVQDKMTHMQEQAQRAMERVGEAAQSVGQKVSDFFQGNPFETPVGRKIELATDATKLATENWGLNMEICDFINSTNEGPRDAMRAIKKRLQTQMGKNNAIVMYTLTVLETCVKNCDIRFTTLVCQKEFAAELVKLISAKFGDAPQIIQERILMLIQSWADAFRGNPALSGVVEMYDELKSKGVEFPATNLDSMAPIITPKQTVFPSTEQKIPVESQAAVKIPAQTQQKSAETTQQKQAYQVQIPTNPIQLTQEQMAKLRSELDIVQINMTVLRELIAQIKPPANNNGDSQEPQPPEDFQFVQELHAACTEMQKRILDLIPVVTNEDVTYELLSINDELNSTFEKYDRCMAKFNSQGVDVTMIPGGSGTTTVAKTTDAAQQRKDDLIDFGESNAVEKKSLDEQLKEIDINSGSVGNTHTKGGGNGMSNEAYIHDQAEVGIHTVAYNKPEPVDQFKKDKEKGENKSAGGSKKADDDGL